MIFFFVFEIVLGVILLSATITQVIIPIINGTSWFPFFKRQRKIEEEIVELQQQLAEKWLEQKVCVLKDKLEPKEK